jgi:hypothetical protein
LIFKKSASLKERANAALSSLQRNVYAMGMLRSRLDSRVNFITNQNGSAASCQELARVLELVKNGEMILHDMSEKIETARFLEEFVMIMDSAASSVSEIKCDLELMVPAAEAALEEMRDAISKVSTGIPAQLMEPALLAEVTAAIAAGKESAAVEVGPPPAQKEEPEAVPA